MDDARLASENQFITEHRLGLARLGPEQYRSFAEKGALMVGRSSPQDFAAEIRYLPVSAMQNYGLLADTRSQIGRSVRAALAQYDPEREIVLLFFYGSDATVYLLDIQRDLIEA